MRIALANFTRRVGMLLASAAFVFTAVFVFSGGAAAAVSVRTQQKKAAAPAAVAAKTAAPVQARAVAAKPAESASKGMSTGITVHGHWVINVLTPGGKLVSHTEFENSLQSGGMLTLTQVLGQQLAVGPWAISLAGTGQCTNLFTGGGGSMPRGSCILLQGFAGSAGIKDCNFSGVLAGSCVADMPAPAALNGSISNTGVVTAATLQFTGGTLLLPNGGNITQVGTVVVLCTNTTSPSACVGSGGAGVLPLLGGRIFTIGAPPAPVTVTAGQIVQVTVTFSFS